MTTPAVQRLGSEEFILVTTFRRSGEGVPTPVWVVRLRDGERIGFYTTMGTAPGPRVPVTSDSTLFCEAVSLGTHLLWLHTWGDRYRNKERGPHVPINVGWSSGVTRIPSEPADIRYDAGTQQIHVGEGIVTGVRPEVWDFRVSGFPVVQRWLQSRTAKGVGRSSNPSFATPLDNIRPTVWEDEWNDELLELLSVLTLTTDGYGTQAEMLQQILASELIPGSELPGPTASERKVPKTI